MCGIAGIIAPRAKSYQDRLESMIESVRHRGPDDRGTYYYPHCALGHTRLSIVDLETGRQPMFSPDRQAALVFNGEIYGYQKIRSELDGYHFQTSSDTEVILALYSRYQENLISRLPGMFAFALWDESRQSLFCARDRFGEKPFFYCFGRNGEFIFASEIKALIASELITPVLSRTSISHYLRHLYVHPHRTIYENVFTLPPAHTLTYRDSHIRVERYWQLPRINDHIEMGEAVDEFKRLLEKAVRNQLIADVPVGAFLSGGLDSTTITAIASRYKSNLQSYSFGFKGIPDELSYARMVARKYGTEHREMSDNNIEIGQLLMEMQKVYDEPFADSSNIPTYLICKLARRHGKSILTGDGGDELLAGYSWYKPLFFMEADPNPSLWKTCLIRLMSRMAAWTDSPKMDQWRYQARALWNWGQHSSITQAHLSQNQYFTNAELLTLELPITSVCLPNTSWPHSDTINDAMFIDVENYLPGDILVKIDRASMANSLELRAPFLDVEFASFCLSLPSRLKMNSRNDKVVLRNAYSNTWPEPIRTRGKQGFGAPLSQWLRMDSVRALEKEYLNDPGKKIFGLIPFERCRTISEKDNSRTWILLVLAIWMENHSFSVSEN